MLTPSLGPSTRALQFELYDQRYHGPRVRLFPTVWNGVEPTNESLVCVLLILFPSMWAGRGTGGWMRWTGNDSEFHGHGGIGYDLGSSLLLILEGHGRILEGNNFAVTASRDLNFVFGQGWLEGHGLGNAGRRAQPYFMPSL